MGKRSLKYKYYKTTWGPGSFEYDTSGGLYCEYYRVKGHKDLYDYWDRTLSAWEETNNNETWEGRQRYMCEKSPSRSKTFEISKLEVVIALGRKAITK